jgi:hypothetical protein
MQFASPAQLSDDRALAAQSFAFWPEWLDSVLEKSLKKRSTVMRSSCRVILNFVTLSFVLLSPVITPSQTAQEKKPQLGAKETEAAGVSEADLLRAQRRAFAISLVTSLANEAKSYRELALRPRVLARAADALWDVDTPTARVLFSQAWEAAEKGDAEELTVKTKDNPPPMVIALRRISGRDLRLEVLSLVARRDRALAEEFLAKLKDATKREVEDSTADSKSKNVTETRSDSEASAKRLQVARTLLEDDQIEQALAFAEPVLDQVNANTIGFLSALRRKNAQAADQRFAMLLARAELDPLSDANTASGLSSYVFTPGLYATFSSDGGVRWTQPDEPAAPPNLPPALRNRFFHAAGSILLRPSPPPEQDFTSSGRVGKFTIIKRLLPLFDQYASDIAMALRARLTTLTGDQARRPIGDDKPLLRQGLEPEETASNADELQDRLNHARTSRERDRIYADAAVALATKGDARARDMAEKIDDSERRVQVRQYVDFKIVSFAIRKKDATEIARLAKAGQLTHTQRAWAYLQVSRVLMDSQRPRALGFLNDATEEARRIASSDPDRVCLLVAAARQLITADSVRAWEIVGEAVKVADSTDKFTGENVQITFPMMMKSGVKFTSIGGEEFGLSGLLRSLTEDDFYRASDLAKSFKNDAPRAVAILAIARVVIEKK